MLSYACVQLHWEYLLENHLTAYWIAISLHQQQNTNINHVVAMVGILLPATCLLFFLSPLSLSESLVDGFYCWQHALSTEIKSFPLSTVAAKELWCNSWQQVKSNRNESYWIAEEISSLQLTGTANGCCCPFNTQLSIYKCALTYWQDCARDEEKRAEGKLRVHVTGKQNRIFYTLLSAPYDFHGNCSRK